jgi:hypothetical protein
MMELDPLDVGSLEFVHMYNQKTHGSIHPSGEDSAFAEGKYSLLYFLSKVQ